MPHAKVKPQHREHARQMRKVLTDAELKLWNAIRGHRLAGIGFRRQLPIAGYIVDFACPSHKIVIELDGFQHAEDAAADYDRRRTETLQQCSWRVLRFWNEDVLKDIDNICLHILRVAEESQQ
ncbi:endonuclease domain-containing protein [Rhizobium nepotum]|uniref:endonuclease domain-containing protein n=1 Tax=Rhizobium nepotum TaxID=1035271 RepID=UPI00336A3455